MLTSIGTPALWMGFVALVVALLAIDLGVFHRKDREISAREALSWTAVWILLALAFDGLLWWRAGATTALDFLTAYLVEKSLSIDNLFVFVLVFGTLRIPPRLQHRVLFWGILGALVLRGAMILAGTALLTRFGWLVQVFGAFLLVAGARLLLQREAEPAPLDRTLAFRAFRRVFPTTHRLDGHRFVTRDLGRWAATPLLLALFLVESSDIVFALDSVPAALGVTLDPFVVFTSNVFAILGLRSLYFAVARLLGRFEYLKVGLALVLGFIGAKMLAAPVVHVPPAVSLAIVLALLGGAVVASLVRSSRRTRAAAAERSTRTG